MNEFLSILEGVGLEMTYDQLDSGADLDPDPELCHAVCGQISACSLLTRHSLTSTSVRLSVVRHLVKCCKQVPAISVIKLRRSHRVDNTHGVMRQSKKRPPTSRENAIVCQLFNPVAIFLF